MNRELGDDEKPAKAAEISADEDSGSAEEELVQKMRTMGEEGLAEYFMQHRDRLHRMISLRMDQRLAQRVDASDVLQEGFVDAAKRLQEFVDNPQVPLMVWIRFLIGQKLAAVHRWHFQAQKRDPRREEVASSQRAPMVDSTIVARELSASITSPSQVVARAEMTQKMLEFLGELDPLDREILVLRHFEELSNNEAAAELSISKGTASKRYVRALTKLNRAMADPNRNPSSNSG